jgi:hypothetical protein
MGDERDEPILEVWLGRTVQMKNWINWQCRDGTSSWKIQPKFRVSEENNHLHGQIEERLKENTDSVARMTSVCM